jgi:hypothetical protein
MKYSILTYVISANMKSKTEFLKTLVLVISIFSLSLHVVAQEIFSTAPEGATILFDGKNFAGWTNCNDGDIKWKIVKGAMEVVPDTAYSCPKIQGLKTRENYRDFQLHVEFRLIGPEDNSGIYIQRRYEIQISNTYKKPFDQYMGGSIYHQKLPDFNVGKAQLEWQTYDIYFRAARYESNGFFQRKTEDARITLVQNGVMIQNNVIVHSKTGVGFDEGPDPGPIMLQDHGTVVQFRNIWIVPGKETGV